MANGRFLGLSATAWMWIGVALIVIVIVVIIVAVVTKEGFTVGGARAHGAHSAIPSPAPNVTQSEALGPYVPYSGGSEYTASGETTSYSPSNGNTVTHAPEVVNLGVYEEGKGPSMSELNQGGAQQQGWSPVEDGNSASEAENSDMSDSESEGPSSSSYGTYPQSQRESPQIPSSFY